MFKALSFGGLGTLALLAALASTQLSSPQPATQPDGHLVLIIEGNANSLRITRIVAKKDPCGPTDTIKSDYQIVMLDSDQREIASYPLDLSQFDLDPNHIGRALKVEGCAVVDTNIAVIANVPYHPNATRILISGPDANLGELETKTYLQLVTAAIAARGQR